MLPTFNINESEMPRELFCLCWCVGIYEQNIWGPQLCLASVGTSVKWLHSDSDSDSDSDYFIVTVF